MGVNKEECLNVSSAIQHDLIQIKEIVEAFCDNYDMCISIETGIDTSGTRYCANIMIDL